MRGPNSPPIHWREPRKPTDDDGPVVESFRRCSYCGSIHPEDLLRVLADGARMHGSDWKYSWPHKFYVEVPNRVNPEVEVAIGHDSRNVPGKPCPRCCNADGTVKPEYAGPDGDRCGACYGRREEIKRTPIMGTIETFHAKWYNVHLHDDFDVEARVAVTEALEKHSGIQFEIVRENGEERLRYRAPSFGYQR